MFKQFIAHVVPALFVLCALPVSAAIQSASDANFSWTSDSLTGLDWLDFDGGAAPSTVNRSWNAVNAQLGTGGAYEGWRFATRQEVQVFIFDITGVSYISDAYLPAYEGITDLVSSYTGYGLIVQNSWWTSKATYGLTSDAGAVGQHFFTVLYDISLYPGEDYYGITDQQSDDFYRADTGSWLVRQSAVVPVPAAVWLLGSALGAFGVTRRRVVKDVV